MRLSDEARDHLGRCPHDYALTDGTVADWCPECRKGSDGGGGTEMIATQGTQDVSYARVHPDELSRLWAVDAAAREYAEAAQATINAVRATPVTAPVPWYMTGAYLQACGREATARTALLTLFAPESPVVSSATTEGER